MREIAELRRLLAEMDKKELLQEKINRHVWVLNERKNHLELQELIPNVQQWSMRLTKSLGKWAFWICILNAILIFVVVILFVSPLCHAASRVPKALKVPRQLRSILWQILWQTIVTLHV